MLTRLAKIAPSAIPHLRHYSAAKEITKTSLCTPLPGFSGSRSSADKNGFQPFDTQISKLDNGIRIASEEHYGEYCTIGVAVESGSRYEASYTKGTSHFVEKLAYSSTLKHASRDDIYSVLEQSGALVDCQSTKDTFLFAASCHRDGLDSVMEILSNAVWRPKITEQELEDARMIVQFENEDLRKRPECEPLITDWLHKAAFRGNTLGFSKFTPEENIDRVSRKEIFSYMSQYHAPSRLVIAGVGVPHDELLSVSKKYFDERSTIWSQDPSLLSNKLPSIDKSTAQYTGGEYKVEADLSKQAVGTPYPHLAHVALGFEGCGYRDPDFVAFCVLQSLFGGGGSFSAGGPGKGMFTRLYVDVLNQHHWLYSATAYNHAYADTGLFCIHASCPPEQINAALIVLTDQFLRLEQGVEEEELLRAKTQLKSQLMMNLEIRPVLFEDLARQIIGHGYRRKPDEYMAKIDSVSAEDMQRVAHRMLSSRPSLVGYGVLKTLQNYQLLEEAVAKKDVKLLFPQKKAFSWQ